MTPADGMSEQAWDAVTNLLATRIAERGLYSEVMGGMPPAERVEVEAALERHAARMRAAGERGW